MKISKKMLVTLSAGTVVGLSSLGLMAAASAATSTSGNSLVDKIATKFNLKKADVQAVFDQEHAERDAQRLADIQTKLATAVKDGKLTQAQSDALLAKIKEVQSIREANKDKFSSMSQTERKAAMDAEKAAMDKWIADNKIPSEFARLVMGGGRGHGHGGGHGFGGPDMDKSGSTSSTKQ